MFVENFSKGFQLAQEVYHLAVLPFLIDTFFLINKAIELTSSNAFQIGVKFSFPFHFPSLTDFFSFPPTAGFQTSLPLSIDQPVIALLSALLSTIAVAYLSAGYLGEINASRLDTPARFTVLASKYFVPILIYGLFWLGLTLVAALLVLTSPGLASIFFVLYFLVYYLVFLTPFAIVVDNLTFSKALDRSITLTTSQASITIPYVILYLVATALASIPIYLIMNVAVLGFFIAIAISALAGTALVASTFYLYIQVTQPPARPITPIPSAPSS